MTLFAALASPSSLLAQASGAGGSPSFLTDIAGLFNIFVGLMLVAALIAYGGGFIVWATRLGSWPSPRDEAIRIMMWAPAILFTLVVLLAVVQFFQNHPRAGAYILSTLALLVVIAVIVYLALHAGAEKDEKE